VPELDFRTSLNIKDRENENLIDFVHTAKGDIGPYAAVEMIHHFFEDTSVSPQDSELVRLDEWGRRSIHP
jgi:hypothetical protein